MYLFSPRSLVTVAGPYQGDISLACSSKPRQSWFLAKDHKIR
jgi:hypothetical protein